MVVSDFSGSPKRGCKCKICGKKVAHVFRFRLCNPCLEELVTADPDKKMTEEDYERYCAPPKSEVN
jgi:hypothetical protein